MTPAEAEQAVIAAAIEYRKCCGANGHTGRCESALALVSGVSCLDMLALETDALLALRSSNLKKVADSFYCCNKGNPE